MIRLIHSWNKASHGNRNLHALGRERTDCWRSVRALRIANDIFEVIEHIPSGESWKFAPFSRVRCRNRIFTDDEPGLEAFEYALESDPNYRLLKAHEKESFRIIFKNGEEAIVRVIHVDGAHQDFVYELLSANSDRANYRTGNDATYVAKFADLVSAQRET